MDERGEFSFTEHDELDGSVRVRLVGELDAAGLRFGAMLRYLQAAQRLVTLRPSPSSLDAEALSKRLKEWDARLSGGGIDHSLGRLFLEAAQADVAGHAADAVDRLLALLGSATTPGAPQDLHARRRRALVALAVVPVLALNSLASRWRSASPVHR